MFNDWRSDLIADELLNASDSFTNYLVQMFLDRLLHYSIRRALTEKEPSRSRDVTPLLAVITLMHDARKKGERKGETAEVSAARERGKKSYRTRRVFEVGCPVALIEPAISGPGEAEREERAVALTQRDASSSGSPPAVHPPELPC